MPNKNNIEDILQYKQEFIDHQEQSIDGSSGLQTMGDICKWLDKVQKCADGRTVFDGLVPSSVYLVYNEQNELIGMVDIRHYLNEQLFQSGGHIGYSVRPSKRRQGYATDILARALKICAQQLNINNVLLTCNAGNVASQKVILANGGILESSCSNENTQKLRYWINTEQYMKH